MNLSPEDNLRLNVLLRQELKAIRIDESQMIVHALTDQGEAQVELNPNAKDDLYLKAVRQLLSNYVLDSPGGYPIFLERWTRMGQQRSDESLKQLLLLGENEAVAAVVHAPVVSEEIARRAWWIEPSSENARRLLEKDLIANSTLGRELAEFLLEFLPFEEDQQAMIDSVKLVLLPGLIADDDCQKLWTRGRNRVSFYIGFLHSRPDDLPDQSAKTNTYAALCRHFDELNELPQNPLARQMRRIASPSGQVFVRTVEKVIKKLNNQDAAVSLFDALENYFASVRPDGPRHRAIDDLVADVSAHCSNANGVNRLYADYPEYCDKIEAILALSMTSEQLLAPVFGQTDAIGSVMRKKLLPITTVLVAQLKRLQD